MGLFNNRPYKVNDLSGAEDAAISASLEVAIDSGADKAVNLWAVSKCE